MKVSGKPFEKQKYPKVLIDKQKPAGSLSGGVLFDSGCNLSGVRRIHIYVGSSRHLFGGRQPHGSVDSNFDSVYKDPYRDYLSHERVDSIESCLRYHVSQKRNTSTVTTGYPEVIERIAFEFKTTMQSGEPLTPSYNGRNTLHGGQRRRILSIDKNDSVTRIDVYQRGQDLSGIQFHLNSGAVSELYGSAGNGVPTASFKGNHPDSKLVGVHGSYVESSIRKLGFTFAGPAPVEEDKDKEETEASAGGSGLLDGNGDGDEPDGDKPKTAPKITLNFQCNPPKMPLNFKRNDAFVMPHYLRDGGTTHMTPRDIEKLSEFLAIPTQADIPVDSDDDDDEYSLIKE